MNNNNTPEQNKEQKTDKTTNLKTNENIRNIAIIAHVDHGKTTLVDAMFRQSGLFRAGLEVEERIMDSMDLERERGITISAKNCSVNWKNTKINIIDTPGHADFSGEVERALSMADGAILLVDASEGPLPQTRFVLKKTLERGLKIIVVVNKIDKKDARPDEILDEIYDLFIDLNADDKQLDFPVLYAIGRDGIAKHNLEDKSENLFDLFDTIITHVSAPKYNPEIPFQMLVSDIGYSDYLGKLAIGRIINGSYTPQIQIKYITENNKSVAFKPKKCQNYSGVTLGDVVSAEPGDIIIVSGMDDIKIGDTICSIDCEEPLERITVDEPTLSMEFTINTSPLCGTEGKIVQAGKIRERLVKETLYNVAIKFEETESRDRFIIKGRGEFQMVIILETMRREGFELSVGRPKVIYKKIDGKLMEPIETAFIDCQEDYLGVVTEKLCQRKGRITNLVNNGFGRVRAEFSVPSRALIGYRDEFLTDTRGTGILNTLFDKYDDYRGDFPSRYKGSIVADRAGNSVAYSLFNLEPRGVLFIAPGEAVYEGMIVGEYNKEGDINVNAVKKKKLSNMRASGKDENTICTPVKPMTLERAINFINEDEMVEVTPLTIRMHKRILSAVMRHQRKSRAEKAKIIE